MFTTIFEQPNFNHIKIKKKDILRICCDRKTDCFLKILLKEYKEIVNEDKIEEFDVLVEIIKKWFGKLDVSRNGFVPVEDVCRFFIAVGAFDNSADAKKVLQKMNSFVSFKIFTHFPGCLKI